MRTLLERRSRVVGAMFLAGCALALFAALTGGVPGLGESDGRLIRAEFAGADDLRAGDAVRVDGVRVGEVSSIRLRASSGTALVSVRITDDGVRLTDQATAALRWGTLLGGSVYVDLDPGSRLARVADSDFIPRTRTSSQVTFDDLNNVYSADTRRATQTLVAELSRGFSDPQTAGATIDALAPNLREVRRGLRPLLGLRAGDLPALVANTARTVHGLGRDPTALRRLVTDAAATLRVTAQERRSLGRMVRGVPPALDSLRSTSARLDRTLRILDPLVERLRPGARRLGPATRAATPALRRAETLLLAARPLLRDLGPALRSLRAAGRPGVALMTGLNPTLARLRDEILPWLDRRDPDTGRTTIEMIGPTAAVTASAAGEFDGVSNWLHFAPQGDERTLLDSPCQPFFTDPTADQKLRCDALTDVIGKLMGAPVRKR